MAVKVFKLEPVTIQALENSFSPDRIATYLTETGGNSEQALHLHTWNIALSSAFYGPLQGLEVAVRNSMHRQLTLTYGPTWYDDPGCDLDAKAISIITRAKDTLTREGYPVDPPHVVAELSFGFWVSLLGKGGRRADNQKTHYEMTLWRPSLHKAFPHSRRNRADTHRPLDYLRTFRNRIAHHEPILRRHLQQDYRSILEVTSWICPTTADWINHHSRVEALLAERAAGGEPTIF